MVALCYGRPSIYEGGRVMDEGAKAIGLHKSNEGRRQCGQCVHFVDGLGEQGV